MRSSHSQIPTDEQINLLEIRRKMLGLTRAALLHRFEKALQSEGCVHTLGAAKMRLDRVFNPLLRRPTSEATLMALAVALDWAFLDLEAALQSAQVVSSLGVFA